MLLNYFLKNPKKRMNARQLAKKLNFNNSKDSVVNALKELQSQDLLRPVSDHKYVLNKRGVRNIAGNGAESEGKTMVGKIDIIRSGAGYVNVPGEDNDVYVPLRHINGAMHKDQVEISVRFFKGKKPEGRVLRVTQRNISRVIGTLRASKSSGVVHFKSRKTELDVFINPKNFNSAKDADKVIVDILSWGDKVSQPVWGRVVRIVNDLDTHDWTMESILVENGFNSDYPDEVMKEIDQIDDAISDEEIQSRRDFRDVLCFTIDPDTAQDFDDAISYKKLENGGYEIGVHIADVTHYVKPGSAIDKEAFNRSTSVYLVDRCIAMLPEKLSNNLCSLVPKKDRLVFSAVFEFDKSFKLKGEWFGKSIIHSDHRFTYDQAQEAIDSEEGLFHEELNIINDIAKSLRKERFDNGAINFETDEVKFRLDENNKPIGIFVKERKEVHMLIEDFMLLANKRVATFIASKSKSAEIPFVYRVHDVPDIEKLVDLKYLLEEYDVTMDLSTPGNIGKSFNTLSERARKDEKYKLLMSFAIRTMAKAIYSTDNIGHYGLGFDYYSHFTSPIRRYSDVLSHRILEKNLSGNYRLDKTKLEAQCVHISNQERRAMDAERDSVKFKQVEYMKEHEGEVFEGMVSGMIERGIFVEVGETKAEGLIAFDTLDENFIVKENRIKAIGTRRGIDLKLGDRVTVKILKADLANRLIEMELIDYK